MRFVSKVVSNLFRPPRTEAFPFAPPEDTPEAYRGKVVIDPDRCVGCSTCAQVCVSDAIRLEALDEGVEVTIWHAKCTFCGLCAYYCPTDAMEVTNDWDLSHRNEDKYAMSDAVVAAYRDCSQCGAKLMVPQEDVISAAIIGHQRAGQTEAPLCETCRRRSKAQQIAGVRL